MPDDEPLDDLRAVAMTAGAAAARVVETVLRDAQNRAQQTAQRLEQATVDAQRRQTAHQALAGMNIQTPTTDNAPAQLPYDSPERRAAADQALRAAGVPDEARHAKTTADLLNGTNPQLAARSGTAAQTRPGRPSKTPERERGR